MTQALGYVNHIFHLCESATVGAVTLQPREQQQHYMTLNWVHRVSRPMQCAMLKQFFVLIMATTAVFASLWHYWIFNFVRNVIY